MTENLDLEQRLGLIEEGIASLDARLKILEEERRVLHEGILKMREEDRRRALTHR